MKPKPSTRLKLAIRGAVQGVGFRPYIYRLAAEHHLAGWVNNSTEGVFIEAEGPKLELEKFLHRLEKETPPRSLIQEVDVSWLEAAGYRDFQIRESESVGSKTTLVLPDIAICPDCLREIFDRQNRRYLYPFTNCTNCGPRFSIIESLPYDRGNTTMKKFGMCPECDREYHDPGDRRFHAQPNACPVCGPRLELWEQNANGSGKQIPVARDHTALLVAARAIRRGQIVAVKGVGGFHLMVDARNERAVHVLRQRKHREEKPFAMLFPSLASIKAVCEVSAVEERILLSPEAPIVLLKRKEDTNCTCGCEPDELGTAISGECICIAQLVAPGNPDFGIMLPSNPLHHLLMAELNFPVVATSGNLTDEPICVDECEALRRLHGIADLYLVHNRPIVRHVDDSIIRIMAGSEMILRRARGFAPLPVLLGVKQRHSKVVLAVGAHLKNSVALAIDDQVFVSQHIGDLESEQANAAFHRVISDFEKLYDVKPEIVATDLHPDYLSTRFAQTRSEQKIGVQHHVAHVLACVTENDVGLPALGICWDGTGYGTDETVWGGEFFTVTENSVERSGHLRTFPLPGGDAAVREPRRSAFGLLYEIFGETLIARGDLIPLQDFSREEILTLHKMISRRINTPRTSSMGRLFDAVASLVGLRQQIRYEAQAAMDLEFAISTHSSDSSYSIPVTGGIPIILDWEPTILEILKDLESHVSVNEISAKFHNGLAEAIVAVATRFGLRNVALSGGCFQNRYLLERSVKRLRYEGFQPFWHRRVPPNDGGIALGQIVAARRETIGTVRRAVHLKAN